MVYNTSCGVEWELCSGVQKKWGMVHCHALPLSQTSNLSVYMLMCNLAVGVHMRMYVPCDSWMSETSAHRMYVLWSCCQGMGQTSIAYDDHISFTHNRPMHLCGWHMTFSGGSGSSGSNTAEPPDILTSSTSCAHVVRCLSSSCSEATERKRR